MPDAPADLVAWQDRRLGAQTQALASAVGDFVVRRADGLWAYQLAVVVDDADQGVTDVVRGADLLDSTPRQIHLQQLLQLPTPQYLHVPVVVNAAGEKLSKQTRAAPVDRSNVLAALHDALRFLGQQPPALDSVDALWRWAIAHWRREAIPRARTRSSSAEGAHA